jgi:hypothetical protein
VWLRIDTGGELITIKLLDLPCLLAFPQVIPVERQAFCFSVE